MTMYVEVRLESNGISSLAVQFFISSCEPLRFNNKTTCPDSLVDTQASGILQPQNDGNDSVLDAVGERENKIGPFPISLVHSQLYGTTKK
jgi:hypothetical protein